VILVDTTIWIDHFRAADELLTDLLLRKLVCVHPFVAGEVALGHIRGRETILREMRRLPRAPVARDEEVAALIERERLYGQGIGYVDAHLLTSVRLAQETQLWTRDRRLAAVAERLFVAAMLLH
jgi:predicted nucleic acid-binding protein